MIRLSFPRRFLLLFIFSVIVAIGISLIQVSYQFFTRPLLKPEQRFTIIVAPGSSATQLLTFLQKHHVVRHRFLWLVWMKLHAMDVALKAGEYQLRYPMTATDLLKNIVLGRMLKHSVTLVNGWTFQRIRQALAQGYGLSHTLNKQSEGDILQHLHSTHASLEGLFYPDTYVYTWQTSDFTILQAAYQQLQQHLQTLWEKRAIGLPYHTPYQALIVASLIEKEAGVSDEHGLIASVIVNRLRKHMRLQIDAAVIYGLSFLNKTILTKANLRVDTPYNTYLHRGLPPTPIAMPSEVSLQAAMHPAHTEYLYYVAKGDGTHVFSKKYSSQLNAIQRYLLPAVRHKNKS